MTLGVVDEGDDKMKLIKAVDSKAENVRLNELTYLNDVVAKNYSHGVSVIWKDLSVTARMKQQRFLGSSVYENRDIIKNVSGCVRPSNMVAIMGASGSGKSTLMSVLANRQIGDFKIQGVIWVEGNKIDLKYMRQISGFVYQDDLFVSSLTVLEHLHFVARMKLDGRISSEYRLQLIRDLLIDVGLMNSANNFIGTESFGRVTLNLSGGERKRLSVATELLTDPNLLFCDEPTTGLDSYSALKLMTVMKDMAAQRNKTIICSIHQPNEQTVSLFDQIILLHRGEIAYIGSQKNALEYFKNLGYHYDGEQNPAEYFIKSLAIVPRNEIETIRGVSNIFQQFKDSEYAKEIYDFIEEETSKKKSDNVPPVSNKMQRISCFRKICLLTNRNLLGIRRDLPIQKMRVLKIELFAILAGLCFMGSIDHTQDGVQALKGVLYMMVAENLLPAYGIMSDILNKMPVFYREYTNNINSPLVFYLSYVISLIPGQVFDSVLLTCIVYFLAGLRPVVSIVLLTIFANFLVIETSSAFGMLSSLITNNCDMSAIIVSAINTINLILSGINVNLRTVPFIISWVRYISWMNYAFEIVLTLQVQDMDNIACRKDVSLPCFKNGTEVLEQLDFSANNLWRNFIAIISICFCLHTCAYLILKIKLYYMYKSKR